MSPHDSQPINFLKLHRKLKRDMLPIGLYTLLKPCHSVLPRFAPKFTVQNFQCMYALQEQFARWWRINSRRSYVRFDGKSVSTYIAPERGFQVTGLLSGSPGHGPTTTITRPIAVRQRVVFKIAGLVGAAPIYLADDCRLLSDVGRRPLQSNSNDMRELLVPWTHIKPVLDFIPGLFFRYNLYRLYSYEVNIGHGQTERGWPLRGSTVSLIPPFSTMDVYRGIT